MSTRIHLSLFLLAAGCATASKLAPPPARAERDLPRIEELGEAQAAYEAALLRESQAEAAGPDDGEKARSEWAAAAIGYAGVATTEAGSRWRVPLLLRAAELRLRAQRWDEAAETAGAAMADPGASAASKAVAARLSATAALAAASAAVKAGQLEKLDLREAARQEASPPPAWKRVVETTDACLERAAAEPPEDGRQPGVSPAELALVAAEVQYAHGQMDDARRRLERVIEEWSSEAEVMEQAAPLLLATFRVPGDQAGHERAVERLLAIVTREAGAAPDGEAKAAFDRTRQALQRAGAAARFAEAERLLADGKASEAARTFEAVAEASGLGEPANALHNAAVAWDHAGKPETAAALRERIVAEHPGSPVAPEDALGLAAYRSRKGDHEAAARLYERFLESWPESPRRCVALQNAASELDLAKRRAEAAARYLAFGSDEACTRTDPDLAARALVRAGKLFEAQAKEAYSGAAAVPGVAGPEAKGLVSEAKRRLRGL